MKKLSIIAIILGLCGVLAACINTPEDAKISPAKGKLTFVFFYTEY